MCMRSPLHCVHNLLCSAEAVHSFLNDESSDAFIAKLWLRLGIHNESASPAGRTAADPAALPHQCQVALCLWGYKKEGVNHAINPWHGFSSY